ncbi:DEAD/DEAH box helicase, partial [Klebsiella pneumoniae]|uniref:DEAD/DEAH box helicase n=1 Tax=Klebsiella pneumoniae TaxID=573 RepID=UPI0013D4EB1A
MANTNLRVIYSIIQQLRMIVIDEAHVFDGALGSSTSFLLRRLISLARSIRRPAMQSVPIQIAASSATIPNAARHMEQLTG